MLYDKIDAKRADVNEATASGPSQGDRRICQITDALEQGVIVWDARGDCDLFNRQVFDVLELDQRMLLQSMNLTDFMAKARERGEFSADDADGFSTLYKEGRSFKYDCHLPSGRVVSASVRPLRNGGHVVAFSDVTDMRRAVLALDSAKAEAELAQFKAAEILKDERARQREASLLAKLDEWLQSCKSLAELYFIVSKFMQRVLPASQGQLFIYSNSRDVLDLACQWNTKGPQDHITPDSCWALRRGRRYHFEPAELCFVCDHVEEAQDAKMDPKSYLCVPIVAHGDTVGMMHIEFDAADVGVEVRDPLKFTSRCGEHISMAIANVKLRDELQDQSTRDPLTGLFNRRYFMDSLRVILGQTASKQGNFALLSVDADKFKTFNDEHGHDAGDVVLEALATKMTEIDYAGTVACRIGGEEFSILLPNADRTRAMAVAEELREAISETRVKYIGGPLPKVTISTGIAIYPTHGTTAKDLIKGADVALYQAKKEGRNCCRVSEGDGMISFD